MFSYVDFVSWISFVLLTVFFFVVFFVQLEEPTQVEVASFDISGISTLRVVLDYPLDTGLFREILTEQIDRVGPGDESSYENIKGHLTEILGKHEPKLTWKMLITDSSENKKLVEIGETETEERVSMYLPTNRADFPVVKVMLFVEEAHE